MKEIEWGLVHFGQEITEVVKTESDIGEVLDTELTKPDIEEPKSEVSQPESPSVFPWWQFFPSREG